MSMSSLRGTLGTSILPDCFGVKAAIVYICQLCLVITSSSHITSSENVFSIFRPIFCLDLIAVFEESYFHFYLIPT